MKYDSLGLLFIGISFVLLVAILVGHRSREHMSNENSAWDNVRYNLEQELSSSYDFDVAEFRRKVVEQNKFYTGGLVDKAIADTQKLTGVPLGKPVPAEVKNTEKLFDERMRLLKEDYDKAKKDNNIIAKESNKLAMQALKSFAKFYMIYASGAHAYKPKSTTDKVSTSVSASVKKIIG